MSKGSFRARRCPIHVFIPFFPLFILLLFFFVFFFSSFCFRFCFLFFSFSFSLVGIPFLCVPSFLLLSLSSLFIYCLSLGHVFSSSYYLLFTCSSSTLSTSHIRIFFFFFILFFIIFFCFSFFSFFLYFSSSCLSLPLCPFHHVLLQHAPPKRHQNTILFLLAEPISQKRHFMGIYSIMLPGTNNIFRNPVL